MKKEVKVAEVKVALAAFFVCVCLVLVGIFVIKTNDGISALKENVTTLATDINTLSVSTTAFQKDATGAIADLNKAVVATKKRTTKLEKKVAKLENANRVQDKKVKNISEFLFKYAKGNSTMTPCEKAEFNKYLKSGDQVIWNEVCKGLEKRLKK